MTTQGDLFAPPEEAYGPEPDEGPHQEPKVPYGYVHPNPFDGLIHQTIAQTTERGARIITVKCGAKMPRLNQWEPPAGATGWPSLVTCPLCQPTPAGFVNACFYAMHLEAYASRKIHKHKEN